MSKLILFLVLVVANSASASVCRYNAGGVNFLMNFYPNGGGAGRLHAEVGQPGLMVLTDERFDGTHLSGVVHAGAQTSFQLKFKRAQNEINVAVASGRITIRSKSTEGEWSMEDAPVTCK